MKLSKDFLWGGAIADFQAEGGYQEGGRGLSTHDFESAGSVDQPRCNTLRMPDGSVALAKSHFFGPDSLPDGQSRPSSPTGTIPATKRWTSTIIIKRTSP